MNLRTASVALVLGCLAGAAPVPAETSSLADVVAQFYPPLLERLALEVRSEAVRKQCYAVLQTNAGGAATVILAAYTNLTSAVVRVLVPDGAGFRVAAESQSDDLAGESCVVHAVDVDKAGLPEAHLKLYSNNASIDWVYSWDGQTLTNLTPVTTDSITGAAESQLINATLVDTNGDGVLEAFSSDLDGDPPSPGRLYQLSNGRFAFERSVVDVFQFERSREAPETELVTVTLPAGARGPFTLRVFNGAIVGGQIWLNGREIVRSDEFATHAAAIERVVTLRPRNTLKVRLAGTSGGRISVVIDAASFAP